MMMGNNLKKPELQEISGKEIKPLKRRIWIWLAPLGALILGGGLAAGYFGFLSFGETEEGVADYLPAETLFLAEVPGSEMVSLNRYLDEWLGGVGKGVGLLGEEGLIEGNLYLALVPVDGGLKAVVLIEFERGREFLNKVLLADNESLNANRPAKFCRGGGWLATRGKYLIMADDERLVGQIMAGTEEPLIKNQNFKKVARDWTNGDLGAGRIYVGPGLPERLLTGPELEMARNFIFSEAGHEVNLDFQNRSLILSGEDLDRDVRGDFPGGDLTNFFHEIMPGRATFGLVGRGETEEILGKMIGGGEVLSKLVLSLEKEFGVVAMGPKDALEIGLVFSVADINQTQLVMEEVEESVLANLAALYPIEKEVLLEDGSGGTELFPDNDRFKFNGLKGSKLRVVNGPKNEGLMVWGIVENKLILANSEAAAEFIEQAINGEERIETISFRPEAETDRFNSVVYLAGRRFWRLAGIPDDWVKASGLATISEIVLLGEEGDEKGMNFESIITFN